MTAWLLATSSPNVEASLNLEAVTPQQAAVELCFRGKGESIRFEMIVQSNGKAGNNRSRQAGEAKATENGSCPVRNKLGYAPQTQVSAHLKWWVDGIEQPEIEKTLGQKSSDTPGLRT
ncbi:hypothetical protein IQ22_00011 [Pseudomonas duriflava]|uniref:Uncharacterized protein n=1 Tax=Pseudomonas duriflava TaxID=459528 RepID=A0A562QNJ8_9PSED|nr:hypothetical protein [Pseudomonas duriflava]TWI58307.1 hypothetical protein IQ22_00011 [Pseudomonas duriflava]